MLVLRKVIIDVFVFGVLALSGESLLADITDVDALPYNSLENSIRVTKDELITIKLIQNNTKHLNLIKTFRKTNGIRTTGTAAGRKRTKKLKPVKGRLKRKQIGTNSLMQSTAPQTNQSTSHSVGVPRKAILRRRKFRKRRRKQKRIGPVFEATTNKGIIFSTRTESNDTINKLIDKLNKNPEDNFDEFKNKKRTGKMVESLKQKFFDPLANITELITSDNVTSENVSRKQNFENNFRRCRRKRGGCAHICNPKGKIKCSCLKGFYLGPNKRSCLDVDECKVDNGGCETECVNLIGFYTCKCPPGFTLAEDRKSCQDINECLLRNGHGPCQDTCVNTLGSYNCSCASLKGTKLGSDGHTCDDLNECNTNNGGCSHNCINTLGQSFCSCPNGMELSSDWKTCQDINECETEEILQSCKNCINTQGSYICLDISEMQSDQSSISTVCKPLFPPHRGFISCTRKGAFQSFTKKGRRRTINSPGTACELVCPTGFRLTGKFNIICETNGNWEGNQTGKCVGAPPPVLTCPPSQHIILEHGSDKVHVKFPSPITDVNWKYITGYPAWAKDLEGTFEKGKHEISFTVRDPTTKLFSSCYFNVVIESNNL